jgi:hypothetical protein
MRACARVVARQHASAGRRAAPGKRSAGPCARPAAQVLTEENVRALRESVRTLTRTLEHVESISGDVGGLTGDGRVKANVRQLIEALSRITSD